MTWNFSYYRALFSSAYSLFDRYTTIDSRLLKLRGYIYVSYTFNFNFFWKMLLFVVRYVYVILPINCQVEETCRQLWPGALEPGRVRPGRDKMQFYAHPWWG